jgi:hypothetical protein
LKFTKLFALAGASFLAMSAAAVAQEAAPAAQPAAAQGAGPQSFGGGHANGTVSGAGCNVARGGPR